MDLKVRCPSCKTLLGVPATLAGKKFRCTKCANVLTAPALGDDAPVEVEVAVTARPSPAKPRPPAVRDSEDDEQDDKHSERRSPARADRSDRKDRRDRSENPDREERSGRRGRCRKEAGSRNFLWLWVGLGAASLGIIVVTIVIVMSVTRETPQAALGKPGMPQNAPPGGNMVGQQVIVDAGGQDFGPPGRAPGGQQVAAGPVPNAIATDSVQSVKHATAMLRVVMGNGQAAEGSGFFALEPGLVLTNAHVVGMLRPGATPPKVIQVVIHSGEPNETIVPGVLLGADPSCDLAAVHVTAPPQVMPKPLSVDTATRLTELQNVYIFGFPFGSQLGKQITVSESKVSSLRKDPFGIIKQVQVNGGMHPGNSGGPVVDARGVVVGVAVSGILGTQINFAVPADQIGPMLQGRARDTEVGAAFKGTSATKLPVRVACIDPLARIQNVKLEVWTGNAGPKRPASAFPPAAQPGDNAKQTVDMTYKDGVATVEIDLPEAPLGGSVWLQPTVLTKTGVKSWGAASAVPATTDPPLERVAALLKPSLVTVPERTVKLEANNQVTIETGQQPTVAIEHIEGTVLEQLSTDPRGVKVQLHPGAITHHAEGAGVKRPVFAQAAMLLEHVSPTFLLSRDGALQDHTYPDALKTLPAAVRAQADYLFHTLTTCYEATSLTAPGGLVQPQTTWSTQAPLTLHTQGKNETVDMHFTCHYEGQRLLPDQEYGYIRVNGEIRGRGIKANSVGGSIHGHILFDLKRGFIGRATITVESEAGAGALIVHTSLEIKLTRDEGNAQKIAKHDPKAPFPQVADPTKAGLPLAKGKVLLKAEGALANTDPIDTRRPSAHFKDYKVKLQAGVAYVIELDTPDSKVLDPFLRLENPKGAAVAFDDDGGGMQNARIVYTPTASGEYRIVATSFLQDQAGPYTLTVSELANEGKKTN